MKDERVNERLSVIKRNNLFIIMTVSILSIILKLLTTNSITFLYSELYLLVTSCIAILIAQIYIWINNIKDERIIKNTLKIYSIGFWFVLISGILVYFMNVSINFIATSSNIIGTNTSLNLTITLCFILSFINIRKNKMTFNYRIIELSRKEYFLSVLKRISYILLYFAFIFGLTFLLDYSLSLNILNLLIVRIALGISAITISFQYLLISIYEKIHFNESVELEEGKRRYISQKVLLLLVLVSINAVILTVLGLLNNLAYVSVNYHAIIELLLIYFRFDSLTFIVLTLIYQMMILKSISQVKLVFPSFFKLFKILIWIQFAISILSWAVTTLIVSKMVYLFFLFDEVVFVYKFSGVLGLVSIIFSLAFQILIFIFLNINYFRIRFLYLSTIFASLLLIIYNLIFIKLINFEDIHMHLFYNSVIGLISVLYVQIVLIIIVRNISQRFQLEERDLETDNIILTT